METRANYVAIGTFVVLVLFGALGALYWLYRSAEPGATATLRIVFTEPVTGLSTGGSVLFNGIRVGEVAALNFPEGGGDSVIAITRVNPSAPIKPDTSATLGFQGLTGVAYISLTGGTADQPSIFAEEDEDSADVPTITAKTSAFTSVLDSAQGVLAKINTTLEEVNTIIADNKDDVDVVVSNVRTVSQALADSAPQISSMISDISTAARSLGAAGPQVQSVVARVDDFLAAIAPERVATIVANVDTFTGTLPDLATDARTVVNNANGLITRLDDAAGTLGEALRAAQSVVEAVDADAINGILEAIRTTAQTIAARSDALGTFIENASVISTDVRAISGPIATRASTVTQAIDDAGALISEARSAVATVGPAVENFSAALAAVSPDQISTIIANADRFSAALAAETDDVGKFVDAATAAAQGLETITTLIAGRDAVIARSLDDASVILDNLRTASVGVPDLVTSVQGRVDQLGNVFGAIDPEAVGAIVTDAQTFVAGLAEQREPLGALITSANAAAGAVETVATAISERTPQFGTILDSVQATASSAETFAASLPAMTENLQPAVDNLAAVLNSIDPQSVDAIVTDAQSFMAGLAEQREPLSALITSANAAAGAVETVATAISERTPQFGTILDSVQATASSAETFAASLPAMTENLQPAVDNLAAVLSAIDPAAVSGVVDDARAISARLAAEAPRITEIVDGVSATVASARTVAENTRTVSQTIAARDQAIAQALDDAAAALANVRTTSDRLPGLVDSVQPGIENLSATLSAIDPAAISEIIENARTFSEAVASQTEPLTRLVTTANQVATQVDSVVGAISVKVPEITGIIDQVSAAATSARTFADGLPELVDTLRPGLTNVSDALQSIDPAALNALIEDARTFMSALAEQSPRIATIAQSVEAASADAARITSRLAGELDTVSAALQDARSSLSDARTFAAQLQPLLESVRPGIVNTGAVLEAIDPEAISSIITNIEGVSLTLSEARGDITNIVTTAGNAARQVDTVATAVAARVGEISSVIQDAATFAGELANVGPRISGIVEGVSEAVDAIRNTVTAVDVATINAILADVRQAAAAVGSRSAEIGAAIDNAVDAARNLADGLSGLGQEDGAVKEVIEGAKRIVRNLEGASQRVGGVVDRIDTLLDGPVQSLVANVSSAAGAVQSVAAAFASRADQIAGGLAKFSRGGLDDLRALLNQGRSTLASIESAVSSFDRDPSRVIFGGPNGPRYQPQRR